jgi:branched-chain amino acid aminotransferase
MQLSNFPVTPVEQSRLSQVNFDKLSFGGVFSDHMFSMVYEEGAWSTVSRLFVDWMVECGSSVRI